MTSPLLPTRSELADLVDAYGKAVAEFARTNGHDGDFRLRRLHLIDAIEQLYIAAESAVEVLV